MPSEPRTLVDELAAAASLPAGRQERFNGYGVMGLPFESGHVLAMRRFPASSVGQGYRSVWHRDPGGAWTFYADVAPRMACTRFFGAAAARTIETDIVIEWREPFRMHVAMPAMSFEWDVTAAPTAATRLMTSAGRLLPGAAWRSPFVLAIMAALAGPLLGAGRLGLYGTAPNGQHFVANPRALWAVVDSRARLAGEDFGAPGPAHPQARLGDFWIPQRGILALGQAYFEPFDPARHSPATSHPANAPHARA